MVLLVLDPNALEGAYLDMKLPELLLESGEAFGSLLCRFHGHEVLDLRGEGRRRFSTLAGRR